MVWIGCLQSYIGLSLVPRLPGSLPLPPSLVQIIITVTHSRRASLKPEYLGVYL